MTNISIITLIGLIIAGITKFLTWYLSPKEQLRIIDEQIEKQKVLLKKALADLDTTYISLIEFELARLHKKRRDIDSK